MSATSVRIDSIRAVITRIVAPTVAAVAAITLLAHASGVTALVVFLAAWVALDVAALTLGEDSREGWQWTSPHAPR